MLHRLRRADAVQAEWTEFNRLVEPQRLRQFRVATTVTPSRSHAALDKSSLNLFLNYFCTFCTPLFVVNLSGFAPLHFQYVSYP